jgi:hypothetical protein
MLGHCEQGAARRRGRGGQPVTVSYRSDLAKLIRLAPYPAVAPAWPA